MHELLSSRLSQACRLWGRIGMQRVRREVLYDGILVRSRSISQFCLCPRRPSSRAVKADLAEAQIK